jgi:gas vesicle structural protein
MIDNDMINDDLHQVTLCEVLDRILNKGVVIAGEVTISVANVDLIYLGLNLLLGSIDTIRNVNTETLNQASNCDLPGMR